MQFSYWSVKGGEQQAGMGAPAGLRNEAQRGFVYCEDLPAITFTFFYNFIMCGQLSSLLFVLSMSKAT